VASVSVSTGFFPQKCFPERKKNTSNPIPIFVGRNLKPTKSTRALKKRTSKHPCQIHMFFGLVGFGAFPSLNVFFVPFPGGLVSGISIAEAQISGF